MDLLCSVQWDNPEIFETNGISIVMVGGKYNLQIVPRAGASGTAKLTAVVEDRSTRAQREFAVTLIEKALSLSRAAEASANFEVFGALPPNGRLLKSANLIDWTQVQTIESGGAFQFENPANGQSEFYRVEGSSPEIFD